MQIVEKYRKILEKPMAEPFRGYIEELMLFIAKKHVDEVALGVNNDNIGKFIKDETRKKYNKAEQERLGVDANGIAITPVHLAEQGINAR